MVPGGVELEIFLCIYMKNISKNLDSNLEKQGQIVKSQKKKESIYTKKRQNNDTFFTFYTVCSI